MRPLFTIGYERASLLELTARLVEVGVSLVVDVRELANSRRPGFSKNALRAGLAEGGISYTHLRPLGTPKAGRTAHQAGRMTESWQAVEQSLETPGAGLALAKLETLASEERVCLLCLEEDPHVCHRSAVTARLGGGPYLITHLREPS